MVHGPVGDTPSTFDDDDYDSGRVVRIASVAALGGLLFGYDSAVINGAVAAVQDHFHIDNATLGFAVASALLGAALGAVTAGRLADKLGRLAVMKIAALLFLISAIGTGLAPSVGGGPVPDHWRDRRRGGLRDRARLHRGNLAAAHTGTPRLTAAACDRVGNLSVAGDRLGARAPGRRVAGGPVVWSAGMALDVHRDGRAGHRVRGAGLYDPRITALSRCEVPDSGSPPGAHPAAGGEEPRTDHFADPEFAACRNAAVLAGFAQAEI